MTIPEKQRAVQLVGPDKLEFNESKPVHRPGPHQILCQVEAVGICFSDLKLLKRFAKHPRKTAIVSGVDLEILKEIPSYVPDDAPTVPGHEAVVRIAEVGEAVTDFKAGERYLVQTDYRWLPSDGSNASFGYDFEGALQEYVLMDERIITSPEGESVLIPAAEKLSASAIALVEPWACVENSYVSAERRSIKEGGRMLVVASGNGAEDEIAGLQERFGRPAEIIKIDIQTPGRIADLEDGHYDDIVYFGSCSKTVGNLFCKLAVKGLLNVVLCGGRLGGDVITPVGRIHYGGIRVVGTAGSDPCESMEHIPPSGEIHEGDRINVVGAGGPMGMMHAIRNVCQGVKDVAVFAGDLNRERLETLRRIVQPIAEKNDVFFSVYNPEEDNVGEKFNYVTIMVPSAKLVAESVRTVGDDAIINVFAGIAADIVCDIDLNAYIEKKTYFIGTSGSLISDMHIVLDKVEAGTLDTNLSVAAICGLEGAIDGIRAVENRAIPGKIVAYPSCKGLGLITFDDLEKDFPNVAECLKDGLWNVEAEKALLESLT